MVGILSLKKESISLEELFGSETQKLSKAMERVKRMWLYPYEGCYTLPRLPLKDLRERAKENGTTMKEEIRKERNYFFMNNPSEKERFHNSRRAWENELDRQLGIVYGIARRHHCNMRWEGNSSPSCGDRWTVRRNGENIATICCC